MNIVTEYFNCLVIFLQQIIIIHVRFGVFMAMKIQTWSYELCH